MEAFFYCDGEARQIEVFQDNEILYLLNQSKIRIGYKNWQIYNRKFRLESVQLLVQQNGMQPM